MQLVLLTKVRVVDYTLGNKAAELVVCVVLGHHGCFAFLYN